MISVSYVKPNFHLIFPFDSDDLKIVQLLPVRKWDKRQKAWIVPELAISTIENLPKSTWTTEAIHRGKQVKNGILKLVDSKFERNGYSNGYLRPYQQIGVNFLTNAKKALLADDMGLGKSIQAIQTLVNLDTKSNLILCPATLKLNWVNEFKKHFNIEPVVISGNQSKRRDLWGQNNKYVIANYDILSRDWQMMPKEWDAIVADEIVFIKNHSSMRTKLVKKLSATYKIGLSGIPMENNLMEFHSIMEWIRPEVITSYNRFKYRYIEFGWDGKISKYKNLEELHLLTSPYILRRKKEDVLQELPPKIYTDFPLELDGKGKIAYEAISNEFLQWLKDQTGKNWHSGALEKLIRLRQFVEFPEIVGFNNLSSIKLEWLKDVYSNLDKIVIFTYFRDSIRLLQEEFNTEFVLTGDTPQSDRIPMVDSFNRADKGVFLLTDAGKFGVNIIGASNVVQFGYFFNPAVMLQREDRLHRIGQVNVVNVFYPYIIDTIDEGIRKIFERRREESNEFLDGSEKMSVSRLSKKEFSELVYGGK